MDNFQDASARMKWSQDVCELYRKVLSSKPWAVDEKVLILSVIDEEMAKIRTAETEYGPHLIWAHQLPAKDLQLRDDEKELTAVLRQIDVLMGKLRRSGHNIG